MVSKASDFRVSVPQGLHLAANPGVGYIPSRKQQEFSAALEKKLASKKEGLLAMNSLYLEQIKMS